MQFLTLIISTLEPVHVFIGIMVIFSGFIGSITILGYLAIKSGTSISIGPFKMNKRNDNE